MGSTKKTIAYRYDSVGNRIGMTDPDGGRFTYAYDAVNRITHLENPQGNRTTYGYDPAGRRSVKKLANGTRASFTYDAAGNLTTLANLKSDNTVISSFDYAYDRMGNRTSVVEADGSRVTWTYDATYQLTGEHRTGSHPYEDSYSYDAAGNRLLKIDDGARTTYAYDAANQIRWSEDASGRTTYTFDADGNQKVVEAPNGDRTTMSWDGENRMTLVQQPDGTRNTMAYEPGGLRVKLEESTGVKKFVWDEQNYLAETDENDDTQVVYTNEPRVYGNLVSQRRGSDCHWYHFDAIGSTRELTDPTETVTDTRLYDPWGVTIDQSGTTSFPFQFGGMYGYYSAGGVQIYVRHRLLDVRTGRWLSHDPLASRRRFQAYVYARNMPLGSIDPSGLLDWETIVGPFPDWPGEFFDVPEGDAANVIRGCCGTYFWRTRWLPAANETNGFIVQRVCITRGEDTVCPGASCSDEYREADVGCDNQFTDCMIVDGELCYYELWRVKDRTVFTGEIFGDDPQGKSATDTFAFLGRMPGDDPGIPCCTQGELTQRVHDGFAFFVPYDELSEEQLARMTDVFVVGERGVRNACSLYSACASSDVAKDLFNELRLLGRGHRAPAKLIRRVWNCCAQPDCQDDSPCVDPCFLGSMRCFKGSSPSECDFEQDRPST